MGNILIVDDDHLIRDGLCLMVKSIEPQESLVTAGNGAEALQILMESSIDLIFTDIKMPVMDGLQLMEKLHEIHYSGEVVIISGFDEFEFARRAMKLGAADYLLKPVKVDELKTVYEECKRRLRLKDGQKRQIHVLPEQSPYLQQSQVSRLLSKDAQYNRQALDLPSYASHVLAIVTDSFGRGLINPDETQQAFAMGQSIADALPKCPQRRLIQGEYLQNWVMLFLLPEDRAAAVAEQVEKAMLAKGLHFGMSQQALPIADCKAAYHQALSALEQHFYDVPPDDGQTQTEVFPYPTHTQLLTDAIAACDVKEATQEFKGLFDRVAADRPNVDALRQHLISMVYTIMNQNKEFIGIIGKHKFTGHDIILKVREAAVFSQLMQDFRGSVFLYIQEILERRLSKDDYAIHRAKAYVDNSYHISVSLVEIAEKLGLHPNYLSSLFHHKTGQTFSEYLRCVRIEKSIQLMNDTNMKIYEIAQQVGYSDTAQFHRAFKQATGISPGQYKQKHT